GLPFGVLVGQARPLGGHDGRAGVVLAGDHLQPELLPLPLALDRLPHRGVGLLQDVHQRVSGGGTDVTSVVLRPGHPISTPAAWSFAGSDPSGWYTTPFHPNRSAASTFTGKSSTNTQSD